MTKEKDYIRLEASSGICANCETDIINLSNEEREKFSWDVPDGEFENGMCEFHCSEGCKDATDHHFKYLKRTKSIALDKDNNLWYWVKQRDTRHPCLKENCRFYDRIDDRGKYFYCDHLSDYLDKETGICAIPKSKLVFSIKYCPHCKKEIKGTKKDLKDLIKCPNCRNFFYFNYQLLDELPNEKLGCET